MTFPQDLGRQVVAVLYVVAMAAIIVGADLAFFKHHLWERLAANIGTAMLFAAFYFRFLKHP